MPPVTKIPLVQLGIISIDFIIIVRIKLSRFNVLHSREFTVARDGIWVIFHILNEFPEPKCQFIQIPLGGKQFPVTTEFKNIFAVYIQAQFRNSLVVKELITYGE